MTVPVMRGAAAAAGVAVGVYGALVVSAWLRYGHASPPARPRDDLLDRFMPAYDIVERHQIRVSAPAAVTLQAAKEQDLRDSPVVRAIFKAREVALGGSAGKRDLPRGLLAEVQDLLGLRVSRHRRDPLADAPPRTPQRRTSFRGFHRP